MTTENQQETKPAERKLEAIELLEMYIDEMHTAGLDDEIEVMLEVAQRLWRGKRTYGNFNLSKEPRDLIKEADEEDIDWLSYRAAAIIKERRSRRNKA